MNAGKITLQFSSTNAFASGVIRFLCHSDFSHVDVVVPEPVPYGYMGASDPGGVMIRPHDYQPFSTRHRMTLQTTTLIADSFHERVRSQLGKPFDDKALRAVLSSEPREWRLPEAWFCSELVTWALEDSGFFPYKLYNAKNRVSPADLINLLNQQFDPVEFAVELETK